MERVSSLTSGQRMDHHGTSVQIQEVFGVHDQDEELQISPVFVPDISLHFVPKRSVLQNPSQMNQQDARPKRCWPDTNCSRWRIHPDYHIATLLSYHNSCQLSFLSLVNFSSPWTHRQVYPFLTPQPRKLVLALSMHVNGANSRRLVVTAKIPVRCARIKVLNAYIFSENGEEKGKRKSTLECTYHKAPWTYQDPSMSVFGITSVKLIHVQTESHERTGGPHAKSRRTDAAIVTTARRNHNHCRSKSIQRAFSLPAGRKQPGSGTPHRQHSCSKGTRWAKQISPANEATSQLSRSLSIDAWPRPNLLDPIKHTEAN